MRAVGVAGALALTVNASSETTVFGVGAESLTIRLATAGGVALGSAARGCATTLNRTGNSSTPYDSFTCAFLTLTEAVHDTAVVALPAVHAMVSELPPPTDSCPKCPVGSATVSV